jgi:hypothetical protein
MMQNKNEEYYFLYSRLDHDSWCRKLWSFHQYNPPSRTFIGSFFPSTVIFVEEEEIERERERNATHNTLRKGC